MRRKRKSTRTSKFTIRLSEATAKDLKLLSSKSGLTRTEVIRRFLNKGFSSLGNWRKNWWVYL